jgi:hypothetical protein
MALAILRRSTDSPILSPRRRHMGQSHSKTKRKRRQKSDKRKDYTAATMAKLRQLERAAAGK